MLYFRLHLIYSFAWHNWAEAWFFIVNLWGRCKGSWSVGVRGGVLVGGLGAERLYAWYSSWGKCTTYMFKSVEVISPYNVVKFSFEPVKFIILSLQLILCVAENHNLPPLHLVLPSRMSPDMTPTMTYELPQHLLIFFFFWKRALNQKNQTSENI